MAEGREEAGADEPQGLGAYQRLFDAIRSGRLPPGSRLRETELAELLGMSRTPVREAIRRLEAEGLVVHAPRHGAVVKTLGHAEVVELYEMRAVLEGTAARMAARHASELEIAELDDLNRRMGEATGDERETTRLNRRFHLALLDAARNRYLARAMTAISNTLVLLGTSTLADSVRAGEALAEHDEILAALAARDPDAAEAAMRRHIGSAERIRLRALREARLSGEEPGPGI